MDRYLQKAGEAIEAATHLLSVEQLARPYDGKWTIAQILEHLTLTFRLNTSALESALERGETRARRPVLAQRLARTLVLDIGYFPRARAPEGVVPTGSIPPDRVRAAIREALVVLDATLARAGDRFGYSTPLLKHAFFAAMTVPQWRKFHWRHTVHHMRQIPLRLAHRAPGAPGGQSEGKS